MAQSNTSVPKTAVINGKTVKLKSFADGLEYYDTKVGGGKEAQNGQTVSVHYSGYLLDGTEFDSTDNRGGQPFQFQLGAGQVIKGWDEGVSTMKIGGKRHLVIPADLAHGDSPPPGAPIPPGATLVFDIELISAQ
jgi:peptidylprolyl isomerase